MSVQTEFEQLWLPRRPLAADDLLRGIYRMSRTDALGKRFIEVNPHALSNLLVVDIDHTDAVLRALDASKHPRPNAVVENPANGHAHAVWALSEAVTRTEYARRKPLAFAAAVTEGLRRAVDGDQGYSGLMTKNPTHNAWETHWLGSDLRSLDDLAHSLSDHMPPPSWNRTRRRKPVGLGRNCTLFETARMWAYREIRNHWGDPGGLAAAIHAEASARNAEFSEPLPASEVRAIAASIHRWIINHSRMWADGPAVYEATFMTMQSARGKKSGVVRAKRSRAIREELES